MRSPPKKPTQKEDKENLNISLRPAEKKQTVAQAFFTEMANNQKEKRTTNPRQLEIAAIETQNDEQENKPNDCKVPHKTNIQSNIQ